MAANAAPIVNITAPLHGSSVAEGDAVTFTAAATDPSEGDLSATLSWSSDRNGVLGTGASLVRSDLSAGVHIITASVTDAGGLPGSDQITLAGSSRSVVELGVEINIIDDGDTSDDAVRIRIYDNNGPDVGGRESPGTVLYPITRLKQFCNVSPPPLSTSIDDASVSSRFV